MYDIYGYHNVPLGGAEEEIAFLGVFLVFYVIIIVIASAASLTTYILNSIGLMTIAKNRGIKNPWMAWIPFASSYLFGMVSDDVNRYKGKQTKHSAILLGLEIASVACIFVGYLLCFGVGVTAGVMSESSGAAASPAILGAFGGIFVILLAFVPMIIYTVFYYIALYNILQTYAPNHAILVLLLTLLVFSPLASIYLFVIRNKQPIFQMPVYGYYPPTQMPVEGYGYPPQPPVQNPNDQVPPTYDPNAQQ